VRRTLAAALLVIVGVEAMALSLPDRHLVPWLAGGAAAVALFALRWHVVREPASSADQSRARDPAESLRRWLARTETLLSWADGSRGDWDKHLRPMLARQFELSTGQRRSRNPESLRATGQMVFGDRLWVWVDPNNIRADDRDEPGPGREVLGEILQRLERT
jgi:hypothetical protein